jgi:hypothetical protein
MHQNPTAVPRGSGSSGHGRKRQVHKFAIYNTSVNSCQEVYFLCYCGRGRDLAKNKNNRRRDLAVKMVKFSDMNFWKEQYG